MPDQPTAPATPPPAAAPTPEAKAPAPEAKAPPVDSKQAVRQTGASFIADRILSQNKADREALDASKKAREEKAKEEKPVKKPDEKPEAKAAETTEEPKTEKTEEPKGGFRRSKAPKPISPEDIARTAAKAAAEAVRQVQPKADPKPRRPAELQLPDEFAEQKEVFQVLAEKHPEKYGTKAAKRIDEQLQEFVAKRESYEKQWRKENPGQEFDLEADEHAEFVEQHYPDIDPDHVKAAKREAADRSVETKVEERVAPLRREMQAKEAVQKLAPIATRNGDAVIKNAVKEVAPELAEFMAPDKLAELADANPSFDRALREVTPEFYAKTQVASMILSPGGDVLLDAKDPTHREVLQDLVAIENHILKTGETTFIGPDKRELEYVPMREYLELSEDERDGKWTTDLSILLGAYQGAFAQKLKARYENFEDLVQKRTGIKAPLVAKKGPDKTAAEAKTEQVPEKKHQSISVPSGSPTVNSGSSGKSEPKNGVDILLGKVFARA
jgi:hypothetical protein